MSINSAMLSGVSGLITNSSALAAISDNIANVNTTAYKRNQVNFANVVTAQAVKGRYSAGGVQAVTRQFISQQGLIQSATSPTDLGISGDGFFVVATKGGSLTANDERVFTRSGSFSVDADGYLVNDAKLYLQGWPVQDDGTFNTNPSDLNMMQSINVKNLGAAVRATGNIVVNANLNKSLTADATKNTTYTTLGAGAMADWAVNQDPATGVQPDFTFEMNVIDSVGATHKVAVAFIKDDATPNLWKAEMYAVPASDISGATNGLIASGNVAFTADGQLDLAAAGTTLFGPTATLNLGASGSAATPRWADSLGIQASDIDLDWSKVTQYASPSTLNSANSDGANVGNVVGVEVSEDGVVSAIFDNSEVRQIAKIGLASFANPDGLAAVSGNAYRATIPSGEFVIKQPGIGGAGEIAAGTLEASTVDLSAEFTGLITTQKAYSASSKIITTADQMLEELINIKR
ncbi:flagellar hook protein FlgE [Phenylobacterium haematophilum]|jgi:flagellar hook protein FlgE|uniref:Flagellar hook protein FlgE n=1 Tax=Phenylobacterium haematophilum TaxID=98513 RepID=A0A840A469_9CAUL|nr:flagellar hook protein FlgE [Phenylobacterium haematophilum]MBB3892271.1 flagellar hook protein FlgE [Phenylobacterium haematophilum]